MSKSKLNCQKNFIGLGWKKQCGSSLGRTRYFRVADDVVRRLLLVLVLLCSSATGNAEEIDAGPRVQFNIPQQRADLAVTEFAEQADLTLIVPHDLVQDKEAHELIGTYSLQEGIDLLLAGTGLSPTFSNRIVLSISADGTSVDQGETMDIKKKTNLLAVLASVFAGGANAQEAADPAEDKEQPVALEEIIVTGSHIRGAGNAGSSIITFTREDLQHTGIATVQELMERLPQNLDDISTDGATGTGNSDISAGNNQGVSSISLRGLGPQSTLVLLNGKRRPGTIEGRAVDISNIPLAMIERIEVLTGGHSAIYGSDAVAGVVNIILRNDYEGAETQIYAGDASNGGDRKELTQVFGKSFERGNITAAYTYSDTQSLDATNSGAVRLPATNGINPIPGAWTLIPDSEKHALVLNGHYQFTDAVELYADALLTNNKNNNVFGFDFRGLFDASTNFDTDTDQYSSVIGARIDAGQFWQFDVSLNHGVVDQTQDLLQLVRGAVGIDRVEANESLLSSLSVIADGPVGSLGNVEITGAIGVEFREENITSTNTNKSDGDITSQIELARTSRSVFAEINAPIVQDGGPGIRALQLSIAGRYDEYTDAGSTFNPQVGVRWSPVHRLNISGSYSTAYRAPDLFTQSRIDNSRIETVSDPLSSTGTSDVFMLNGVVPDLLPEEADTWSLGFEFEPVTGVRISVSYFDIEYKGRIATPASGSDRFLVLENENVFEDLLTRNPSAAELASVDDFLVGTILFNRTGTPFDPATENIGDVFPGLVLFDNRQNNVSIDAMNGYDFSLLWNIDTGNGDFAFGIDGVRYLDYHSKITATGPAIDQLDRVGKLVKLKARAHAGWKGEAFSTFAYVNYVDSYENTFSDPISEIESWTTVDLTLRFDSSALVDRGLFADTSITLGLNNALDEKPPEFVQAENGLGHDPINSNALGRFISLRYVKSW